MLRLLILALLAVPTWTAVTPTPAHERLLRQSDVGARAPEAFVARLTLTKRRDGKQHAIEVWRSGTTRLLVRFLDPAERGRYLLRRGQDMWLLTPDAKRPVKLNLAYRVYSGVNLDEILGVRLQDAYDVQTIEEGLGDDGEALTAFTLTARGNAVFPGIRHVVRNRDARPVSTDYRLASGRTASTIEVTTWATRPVLHASRFVVRDGLRKGDTADIVILSVEPRPVPDALFDLTDAAARRRLEAGASP